MTSASPRTRAASIALTGLWVLVTCLLVAAGRSLYARTYLARMLHQTITITPDVPLTRKDPRYGIRPVPGHFDVAIDVPEATSPYRFTMDIDEDGYRKTSADPDLHAGQPAVWIFGCSFTWGYPLDNEDTYPWLIQSALPDHSVRNFGVHGVGNLRALMQMRELLEELKLDPPLVAVFGYASFHKTRNVSGAPDAEPVDGELRGHLADYHSVLGEEALGAVTVPAEIQDPVQLEETQVTFAIFDQLARLCHAHGILPVLAVQHTRGGYDPVLGFAEQQGFEIARMQVDFRQPIYNVMPFDNHPNAAANLIYADKLLPVVQRLLSDG